MSFIERYPMLVGFWLFAAFPIAATLASRVLHMDSGWIVISLGIVVFAIPLALPGLIRVGVRRLRRN